MTTYDLMMVPGFSKQADLDKAVRESKKRMTASTTRRAVGLALMNARAKKQQMRFKQ